MCVSPITIKVDRPHPNSPNIRMVQVPCGKCPICIKKYQNSWTIRIIEEFKNWPVSTFLTLTYAPENVPIMVQKSTGEAYYTVCKQHIKDWFKRFRTYYKRLYKKDAVFKYFLCAEYGPLTLRPHYHCIIFGLDVSELHLAINDWRKRFGFVRSDRIDSSTVKSRLNTARYLGNYTNKGHFETPLVEQKKVLPVFRLVSKGLGKSYVDKHKDMILRKSLGGDRYDDIIDKLNYNINGFNYSLPRYYKDKILPPKSYIRSKIADTLLARNDEAYCDKLRAISSAQNVSEPQASTIMALSEIDALRQRVDEIEERQNKVLKKSKI